MSALAVRTSVGACEIKDEGCWNEADETDGRDFQVRLMTRLRRLLVMCVVLLLVAQGMKAGALEAGRMDEHFSVREYNLFHDVLHPLQHEALPKKDFGRIRARADELYARGLAIVKLGIPPGVGETTEFAKELKGFARALRQFRADARKRSNARLEASYSAVHDAFEILASMLPRK